MISIKSIIIGMTLSLSIISQAQVGVSVHIGSPPPWGPAGYTGMRYYYLPDVESYYDVQTSMFIYFDNGAWVRRPYLSHRYRNYDLYSGYKVVVSDYRGNSPYAHYNEHRIKYARGYRGESQRSIGERPGRGYSHEKSFHNEGHGNKDNGHREREVSHGNNERDRGNRDVGRGKEESGHGNKDGGHGNGGDEGRRR